MTPVPACKLTFKDEPSRLHITQQRHLLPSASSAKTAVDVELAHTITTISAGQNNYCIGCGNVCNVRNIIPGIVKQRYFRASYTLAVALSASVSH